MISELSTCGVSPATTPAGGRPPMPNGPCPSKRFKSIVSNVLCPGLLAVGKKIRRAASLLLGRGRNLLRQDIYHPTGENSRPADQIFANGTWQQSTSNSQRKCRKTKSSTRREEIQLCKINRESSFFPPEE